MDSIVNYIRQRLSLRKPLAEALELTARLTDKLSLQKSPTDEQALKDYINKELNEVKSIVPSVKGFDRDFPSLAFSIATGIGKTRLMGAIIAYLYLKKGIKHFFILAPNLTLYEKLIKDFGDGAYSKYVFKGISEFVGKPPKIVNGENYLEQRTSLFSDFEINIFNISKFNKDSKESKTGLPRMRRLSEYLGQSYFDYLASLPDLVILMDEAHRYHGDSSKKAINELRPILGFEMTATPFDEKGKPFKNIVFEYNLAEALDEGLYVKNPTISKARNFNKDNFTREEIEIIKLEDGISVHENAKLAIEMYAKQNGLPVVKPFILVACKDINHAKEVEDLLQSDRIYNGKYKGKVLRIDSSSKNDEDIERQFVALESPDNKIEIVVHVDMLKEGWDVNNLYTIIPLRAANAAVLIEQTIGRGLRLPYGGQRTGNKDVDTLTVIAHDNFDKVIAEAQKGDSILNKVSFIELDEKDYRDQGGRVEPTPTSTQKKIETEIEKKKGIISEKQRANLTQVGKAVETAMVDIAATNASEVKSFDDLQKTEIKEQLRQKAIETIKESVKDNLFGEVEAAEQIAQVDEVINYVLEDHKKTVIEIPRIVIEQQNVKAVFEDFDLDTSNGYDIDELRREIIRVDLKDPEGIEVITGKSGSSKRPAVEQLISSLIDFDDLDYDEISDLLYKLVNQAIDAIRNYAPGISDNELNERVHAYKKILAENIYKQMKAHYRIIPGEFKINKVLPFSKILEQFKIKNNWGILDFHAPLPKPKSNVVKYVYVGFKKSYYTEYKFDSSTELDFAYILETNNEVLKWIRPVPNQFNIYWSSGAKKYEPDFIVETADIIYMCETKAEKDIKDADVLAKAEAAGEFCRRATEFTAKTGGKPWRYVLIPHTLVDRSYSFNYILQQSKLK
ncbi:MAG: DEAD/DEAH box helicase family protein [Muribaculaceae bacterium]|nr:DEAD/DEAH box helicase family protein [Muribaculaceae bacterium]